MVISCAVLSQSRCTFMPMSQTLHLLQMASLQPLNPFTLYFLQVSVQYYFTHRLPSCQDWTKRNFFELCTLISFPSQCIYAPGIQGIHLNKLAMKEAKKAFEIQSSQFNRPQENSTKQYSSLVYCILECTPDSTCSLPCHPNRRDGSAENIHFCFGDQEGTH